MRLDSPLIRLALQVDAARLAAEVAAIPADAWHAHPEGAPGNTAVPLVAAHGDADDNATQGPMQPTPWLLSMPYTQSVLAALSATIGRTRLMRIESEGHLGAHVDTNRYWQDHLRVHIPVITDPSVLFTVADHSAHMAAGEVWVFDTWRPHGVDNPAGHDRIHLVVDTVGSGRLWGLIDAGERHGTLGTAVGQIVADGSSAPVYEAGIEPTLTPPWQHRAMAGVILHDLPLNAPQELRIALRDFTSDWYALWQAHGASPAGRGAFTQLIDDFDALLDRLPRTVLTNGTGASEAIRQLLLRPAQHTLSSSLRANPVPAAASQRRPVVATSRLDRPVFIVSSPRSGSTLLFETLARAKGPFTIGGESHQVFESIPELHPANRQWSSNVLGADDATDPVVYRLTESFIVGAIDRDGRPPAGLAPIRLLEKTPKNALRVPFLAKAYPDAMFVYLHRDPRATVSSILDAWKSGRYVTYPRLPGWGQTPWSLLLVPGWRDYIGRQLEEVAALQWATTTTILLDDLAALDPSRWTIAGHEELLADPNAVVERLSRQLGFEWDRPLVGPPPLSRSTLDAPAADKWIRNAGAIANVQHLIDPVAGRVSALVAAPPTGPQPQRRATSAPRRNDPATDDGNAAFESVYTTSVADLLHQTSCSVAVTTYQSGRVVLLRTNEDGTLNTHLRAFPRPMGLAVSPTRLALGTDQAIWQFENQPALAPRLPEGRHDACFVPRSAHVTGDVSVHEMAWAADELWFVNTRFSCLATLDQQYSFVPRWRPPFVTALAAEDRCHLNGLAVVDNRPRFVTAMGMTDEVQGWRRNKVGGGVVIDIDDNSIVADGLAMPHSPRWHDGKLWVLDSGRGTLCAVDLSRGAAEEVVRLPGFARGLAFIGRYALVGLSKVREHVFAGLPLAEHVNERRCGVWVVDTVAATIVGFLRFEGSVEEVFDVQVLAGIRYPELLEPGDSLNSGAFVLPDGAMLDVTQP